MVPALTPRNKKQRIATVKALKILDTPPEERFDRITKLVTQLLSVPISTITLVDTNRERHKSVCGLEGREGDRASARRW